MPKTICYLVVSSSHDSYEVHAAYRKLDDALSRAAALNDARRDKMSLFLDRPAVESRVEVLNFYDGEDA